MVGGHDCFVGARSVAEGELDAHGGRVQLLTEKEEEGIAVSFNQFGALVLHRGWQFLANILQSLNYKKKVI